MIAPTASTDSIKLLETGRVNFAILDIHDLAIAARSAPIHPDLVGIMAIVERPLAAVIAQPQIRRPASSRARRSGSPAIPSDTAVLDRRSPGPAAIPRRCKTITIGFNAVADLLAGRVRRAPPRSGTTRA